MVRRNPYDSPDETFRLDLNPVVLTAASQAAHAMPFTYHVGSYPNPFNPSTTILVTCPYDEEAEIAVFNILGQRIKTLYRGVIHSGSQYYRWDGVNDHGVPVAAGMYITRLKTNSNILSTKLVLLK